jgi:hypothetical protein
MHTFKQLNDELQAQYPLTAEFWTYYHLNKYNYPKIDLDWGQCLVYHFDKGISITLWLELVKTIENLISLSTLKKIIYFVPFYETGVDFFSQCKPPYDGGYSTSMYEEFIQYGSCKPPESFSQQLQDLRTQINQAINSLSLSKNAKDKLLSKIIHNTFIKPYGQLFWLEDCDEANWAIYYPSITVEDIEAWQKLPQT